MKSAKIPRTASSDFSIARLLTEDCTAARSNNSDSSSLRLPAAGLNPKASAASPAEFAEDGSGSHPLPLANTASMISFNRDDIIERRERSVTDSKPGVMMEAKSWHDFGERPIDTRPFNECPKVNDLPWLRYTRYRPPKLPRRPLAETSTKRRAGLHPRIPFSSHQLRVLEDNYQRSAYLSRRDVSELSASLRLPQNRVKVWFQNRRARDRRELHLAQ